MTYRNLGNSGLKVSVLACGTHDFRDQSVATGVVKAAFDSGINFFDTAGSYGEKGEVEILTGKALRPLPRDEIVLATKVRWGYGAQGPNAKGLSRKHIRHAVETSLKNLDVDFIDLYQLHGFVADCPVEETVRAMGDLIRQGKILYWGLSNLNAASTLLMIHAADSLGVERPISHQPEYNLMQPGLVDTAGKYVGLDQLVVRYGFGIIPYAPLAGGVLTGKYLDGIPPQSRMNGEIWKGWKKQALSDANVAFTRALVPLAAALGATMGQLSLAWVLGHAFVSSAITAFRDVGQLEQSLKAVDLVLDPDTLTKLNQLRGDYLTGALPLNASEPQTSRSRR